MAGFVRPWDDELNSAQSLITRLRDAADAVKHHQEWLTTVTAGGEAIWIGQGADADQIATLRGAFNQLSTGLAGVDWAYAQNLYRGT
jgi:hypothetical protein